MKHSENQNKESGKAQIALLAAVVLAAGGAGVWSELHAATVAQQLGSITAVGAGFGSISDNGDGTATVQVFDALTDDQGLLTFILGGYDPANTSYSKTVSIKPGMSGNQIGSGTGSASLAGDILDFSTFTDTPVLVSVQLGVDNTANQASAF